MVMIMTKFYDVTKALAAGIFKKPSPIIPDGALPSDTPPGKLLAEMRAFFYAKQFAEGDKHLREAYDKNQPLIMAVAIDFYAKLSELEESELEASGFSVNAIGQGIADVMNFYEVKVQKKQDGENGMNRIEIEPEEGKSQFYCLTKALAKAVFQAPSQFIPENAFSADSVPGKFFAELLELFNARKLTEAEEKLKAAYDPKKPIFVQMAVDFYTRVSELPAEELEKADFSQTKVGLGLAEALKAYGIKLQQPTENVPQLLNVEPEEGKSQFYNLIKAIAVNIFKLPSHIIPDDTVEDHTESGKFYKQLRALYDAGNFVEAEEMLKASYDKTNLVFARFALDFYGRLSELSEEELQAHNLTLNQIGQGLDAMLKAYEVKIQREAGSSVDPSLTKPEEGKSKYYNLTKILAGAVFRKPSPIIPEDALPEKSEPGIIWRRLRQLIDSRSVNVAENLLFDSFKIDQPVYAAIALDFYARLSQMSEDDLADCNFSMEEIGEGIGDMMKFYGIKIRVKQPDGSEKEADADALLQMQNPNAGSGEGKDA